MWKMVIADDENKIRRGIEKILDWHEFNIDIVGEAEDGEIALMVIKEKTPDIILLDINMPFLNGLSLLQELKNINYKGITIIISGYDDFSYVKKALQYNVFDYVLKPVNKKSMEEIITKAVAKLSEIEKDNNYLTWVKKQVSDNSYALKKTFFGEWLNNQLTDEQVLKEMEFFNIEFGKNIGIMVVKLVDKLNVEIINKRWDIGLLNFAIANILEDKFKKAKVNFVFDDDKKNVILINKIDDILEWIAFRNELEAEIYKYLKYKVIIEQANVSDGILKIKEAYLKVISSVNKKKKYSYISLSTIKYIEENYYLNGLNINDISNKLEVTSSYLSKLLKKETGFSFIDYVTDVRINRAMCIMEDTTIKIYDVAELIGYSNQHYFCRAFKKVVGTSPTEYKRGK